jgi:hypothetical protein
MLSVSPNFQPEFSPISEQSNFSHQSDNVFDTAMAAREASFKQTNYNYNLTRLETEMAMREIDKLNFHTPNPNPYRDASSKMSANSTQRALETFNVAQELALAKSAELERRVQKYIIDQNLIHSAPAKLALKYNTVTDTHACAGAPEYTSYEQINNAQLNFTERRLAIAKLLSEELSRSMTPESKQTFLNARMSESEMERPWSSNTEDNNYALSPFDERLLHQNVRETDLEQSPILSNYQLRERKPIKYTK